MFKDIVEPSGSDPFAQYGTQKRAKLASGSAQVLDGLTTPSRSREIKEQEFSDSQSTLTGVSEVEIQ